MPHGGREGSGQALCGPGIHARVICNDDRPGAKLSADDIELEGEVLRGPRTVVTEEIDCRQFLDKCRKEVFA